jgi:phosphatidate cytidylyltransferase
LNTFLTRTISGALYAVIILGAILSGPAVFGALMLIFLVLALFEFSRITHKIGKAPAFSLLLVSSGVIYIITILTIFHLLPLRVFFFALALLPAAILLQLFSKSKGTMERTGMLLLGFTYLTIPLLLLNILYYRDFYFEDPAPYLLFGLFLITWVNDTFAYITGSLFGKNKLARHISPNKTIEGALGGLLFSLVGGYVLSLLFTDYSLLQWLIIAVITVIFGTFGDLFESTLKRRAGLKESGHIIPGHGGILDRIDSILIATPFVFVYVYFMLW